MHDCAPKQNEAVPFCNVEKKTYRYFTPEEEKHIVDCLFALEESGFPLTIAEAKKLIADLYKRKYNEQKIINSNWFYNWKMRHHKISLKTAKNLPAKRAANFNYECIENFFFELKIIMTKLDLMDAIFVDVDVDD